MKPSLHSCRQTHGGAVLPPPRLTPFRERMGEGSSAPAQRASTAARPKGPSVAARRLDADPVSPRGQGRRGGGRTSPPGTKPPQASSGCSLRACGVEGRRAPRDRVPRGRGVFVYDHQLQAHRSSFGILKRDPSSRRVWLVYVAVFLEGLKLPPSRSIADHLGDHVCVRGASSARLVDHGLQHPLLSIGQPAQHRSTRRWIFLRRDLHRTANVGYTNVRGVARGCTAHTASPMSGLGSSAIGEAVTPLSALTSGSDEWSPNHGD